MTNHVLAHTVVGDGPPLLLLNGGLMSMAAWDPLMPAFQPAHRVIRCDFRGQLLSPGAPPASFDGHADALVQLLDVLGLDSVHVVGVSFGALVGLVLAAKAPARVRSLVALNATDHMTPEMDAGSLAIVEACADAQRGGDAGRVMDLVNPITWSPEFLSANAELIAARRRGVGMLPKTWFAGLEQIGRSLVRLDLRPWLPMITAPTLVLGGEKDLTFAVEHSRALAAQIPGARLAVISNGSHGMVIESAPIVLPHILAFVRDAEAARAPA